MVCDESADGVKVTVGSTVIMVGFAPESSQVKPMPTRRTDSALLRVLRLPEPVVTSADGYGEVVKGVPATSLHEPFWSTVEVMEKAVRRTYSAENLKITRFSI